MKNKTRWRKLADGSWQYMLPLAVIGTVRKAEEREGSWYWSARVMLDCLIKSAGPSPQGYATSFEGAKRIVEVLCAETGTIE